jgi:pimeloyl-ACP methyl ester carboxylesterase
MYVQYLIPQEIRHPLPIVLVHGGGGQGTDYMGLDGDAGWAHYYVQAGYQTYIVDRPGHGRSPFHRDALGEMGPHPGLEFPSSQFRLAATATPKRWPGTGLPGDPRLDQFAASSNAAMRDNELAQRLWRTRGGMLLDTIGPAIVQTHSAGGPFGWLTAAEKPDLVKAVVCFEGAGLPQGQSLTLPNIPVLYFESDRGFSMGQNVVAALKQTGANAEYLNLRDRGIRGNSHFALVETNRKAIFEVLRGWIESKIPARATTTARA